MSRTTNNPSIKHHNVFDTSQLIKYSNNTEKSSLISEIEVRPNEHCQVVLGTFNNSNRPVGFTIHSKPSIDSVGTTKITTQVYKKSFKLFLHIRNSKDCILNVEVRQLHEDPMKYPKKNMTHYALAIIVSAIASTDSALAIDGAAQTESFIKNIITTLVAIAGATAVVFMVIGGFKYITSSGHPEKLDNAKKTLLYSGVGLVIVLAAYAIVDFVAGLAKSSFGS